MPSDSNLKMELSVKDMPKVINKLRREMAAIVRRVAWCQENLDVRRALCEVADEFEFSKGGK